MPNRRAAPLALLSVLALALAAPPAEAEEVDPCEVDVGQCGIVRVVQDCVQGEIDLCNTDDSVVEDCLQWEVPVCALAWNEVQYCLQGPSPICRQVDACIDGEPGLCQQVLDEVGQCFPLGDGSDVCDDAWNTFMACQQPGAPCWLVAGVLIECLGNDYQPSPLVPCEVVWAHLNACLDGGPGLCDTVMSCVRSEAPCPVRHGEAFECVLRLVLSRQVCDEV
jgi:hypothetical protein